MIVSHTPKTTFAQRFSRTMTNAFHLYGFNNCNGKIACAHLHCEAEKVNGWHYTRNTKNRIVMLVLAALPVLGQIIGLLEIAVGAKAYFSTDNIERHNGRSLLLRGLLTFIGLGILCLLIDIIVTSVAYIKDYGVDNRESRFL